MDISKLVELLKAGEGEKIEFKQNVGDDCAKVVCAFANTSGGILIIGVNDEGKIVGTGDKAVQELSDFVSGIVPVPVIEIEKISLGDKLLVIGVVKKSEKIHSVRHVVYIRLGRNNKPLDTQEIIERANEYLELSFDSIESKHGIGELDLNVVEWYLKRREEARNLRPLKSLHDNLSSLKISTANKLLTNGGLLFFTQNPQKYFPHAKLRFIWFKDNEMKEYVEDKEFTGPVWKIIDEFYEYFVKNISIVGGRIIGAQRQDFPEYPLAAIREAVINALVHRNYFDSTEIQVFRFPTKLVIKNPGGFPQGITLDKPDHKPRNSLLCRYLFDTGYIEKYGAGLIRMQEECNKHPLVSVHFETLPFRTTVSFVKDKELQLLDEREQKMLVLIKTGLTEVKEIQKQIKLSKPSLIKHLNKLISIGIIQKTGKGRATKYKPIENH